MPKTRPRIPSPAMETESVVAVPSRCATSSRPCDRTLGKNTMLGKDTTLGKDTMLGKDIMLGKDTTLKKDTMLAILRFQLQSVTIGIQDPFLPALIGNTAG